MDELQAKGNILPESRKQFFGNQIALIVPKDSLLPIAEFGSCVLNVLNL
jgi:ABC-type molybdate transport system substrate-binding protein